MPILRPSARVRLKIRVEEFAQVKELRARLKKDVSANGGDLALKPDATNVEISAELARVEREIQRLTAQRSIVSDYEQRRARLERKRDELQRREDGKGRKQKQPNSLAGAPPDNLVIEGDVIPRSVSIERNGLRSADTCSIELDYSDAPIDPRVIRACYVEVYVGTVSDEQFEQGIAGQRREDGMLRSVVDADNAAQGPLGNVTKFVGWVDDWSASFDGESANTVSLKCRDMSAIFYDQLLDSSERIDLSLPIEKGVKKLIDAFPSTAGIDVFFGRPEESPGSGPVPGKAVPSIRKARRGKVSKRAKAGDERMDLWSHIQETITAIGFVPIFFGADIHIIDPRTFFTGQDAPKRVVWGENLADLQFNRKIGGIKTPTVEVRSYDPERGRTVWARYPTPRGSRSEGVFGITPPPEPQRAEKTGVSGSSPSDNITVFTVKGITDPVSLQTIAKSTFNQIGRQEIEGNFSTSDITSFDSNESADLLNLKAGDAIEILIKSSEQESSQRSDGTRTTIQDLQSMSVQKRTDYLKSLGWPERTATRLAVLQEATNFQTVFRVQDVSINWKHSDGLDTKVSFVNFIVVREDSLSEDPTKAPEKPSQEVETAVGENRSAQAQRLKDVSGRRKTLTRRRQDGDISAQDYSKAMDDILKEERNAKLAFDS